MDQWTTLLVGAYIILVLISLSNSLTISIFMILDIHIAGIVVRASSWRIYFAVALSTTSKSVSCSNFLSPLMSSGCKSLLISWCRPVAGADWGVSGKYRAKVGFLWRYAEFRLTTWAEAYISVVAEARLRRFHEARDFVRGSQVISRKNWYIFVEEIPWFFWKSYFHRLRQSVDYQLIIGNIEQALPFSAKCGIHFAEVVGACSCHGVVTASSYCSNSRWLRAHSGRGYRIWSRACGATDICL